ncbi:MAG: prepilin peptidase [Magnetococcales bacterium]|nr:prepilin peptidase [Magnetococcales bacterium]
MYWELGVIVFVYGAVIGSFLNVCIYRIPLQENIAFPASHCPACKSKIPWTDNIPIFGWLRLKGKCRQCDEKISITYPLVELLTALMSVGIIHGWGFSLESVALLILAYAFIVLTVIDFYHYILPDVITLPGIVLGVLLAALPWLGAPHATLMDSIIGVVAGGGGLWGFAWLFEKITGKVGMGFGDVKLLALIGAWMGWQALPFTIFFSSVLGSVVGLTWILIAGRDRSLPIPFGPYLIISAWVFLLYGQRIYDWYWGLVL